MDFALQAIPFFQAMARRDHFVFETTTNWNDLNAAVLKNYQIVVWLDDAPARPAQRAAFQDYMEHGGGWLGFHIAGYMDSRSTWPWFADFLGTVFAGNSWPPLPATLIIDDRAHPAGKGLPARYVSPANEWYFWKPDPRRNPRHQSVDDAGSLQFPTGIQGYDFRRRHSCDVDQCEIQNDLHEYGPREQDLRQRAAESLL